MVEPENTMLTDSKGNTKMKFFVTTTAALLLPMTMSANVQCGDAVSGVVNLTADLVCKNKTALIVAADNTTINLNGFTISCEGPGVAGTCQRMLDANGVTQPPFDAMGVAANGKSRVTIQGPGTISGFSIGIRMQGGEALKVDQVLVDGPSQTDIYVNRRTLTPGILLVGQTCPASTRTSAVITNNTIQNQSVGVFLQSAACVMVSANTIQDNNGRYNEVHGIKLVNSSRNTISSNSLTRNGANRNAGNYADSAIAITTGLNGVSSNNRIYRNNAIANCGDGIAIAEAASGNIIELNVVRYNGQGLDSNQCFNVLPGTFFDLAERNASGTNTWNTNNACRTNSITIPFGVCGPLE